MGKYYIVPQENQAYELNAVNSNDAMASFAAAMESDMNTYFKALNEEEYKRYVEEHSDYAAHARHVTAFMRDKLIEDFGVSDEDADDISESAYDRYCEGKGETEYECIIWAYEEFCGENKNS